MPSLLLCAEFSPEFSCQSLPHLLHGRGRAHACKNGRSSKATVFEPAGLSHETTRQATGLSSTKHKDFHNFKLHMHVFRLRFVSAPRPRQETRADGTTRIGIELAPVGAGTPANDRPPRTGRGNRERTTGDNSKEASRARGGAASLHCTVFCHVELCLTAQTLLLFVVSLSTLPRATRLLGANDASDVATCHANTQPIRKKTNMFQRSVAANRNKHERRATQHQLHTWKTKKPKMTPCEERNKTNTTNHRQTQIPLRYGHGFGLLDLLT